MDVALEVRQSNQPLRLAQQGGLAPVLDDAPLMRHNGTKMTAAEAASLADETELDLSDGGHASHLVIGGVPCIAIRQLVNFIKLFRRQRKSRRILHYADLLILLDESSPAQRILFQVFEAKGLGKLPFVPRNRFIRRKLQVVPYIVAVRHAIACAAHILHILDRNACMKLCRNLDDLPLPHAIDEKICAAFHEDGRAHLIAPIVIMRHAAQARLNSSDDDGNGAPSLAQALRVDAHGSFGTAVHAPARRIGILTAYLLRRREAREHRIEVAARHKKGKPRLA